MCDGEGLRAVVTTSIVCAAAAATAAAVVYVKLHTRAFFGSIKHTRTNTSVNKKQAFLFSNLDMKPRTVAAGGRFSLKLLFEDKK